MYKFPKYIVEFSIEEDTCHGKMSGDNFEFFYSSEDSDKRFNELNNAFGVYNVSLRTFSFQLDFDKIPKNHKSKILTEEEQLSLAVKLASDIHYNQFDLQGKPYILHPLHLMSQLLFDTQLATIAVLHDCIEDSKGKLTLEDLYNFGFSDRVLYAEDLLTHNKTEDYISVYIRRICTNYDAIRVKRKDLSHNSCITRLKGFREKDHDRVIKYHSAFTILGKAKEKFINTKR